MHKLFENSSWLLADKLSKLFPGIVVTALIARHLGPEQFGIWNYALALTTIIGSIAVLGMDKVAVKEFINHEHEQGTILSTIITMRFLAGVICMILSMGIVIFSRQQQPIYLYSTVFSSLLIVLQSFDVLDYFYQAKQQVKRVIIPKVIVFLSFCAIKLLVVFLNGTLTTFLWVAVIELVVTYSIIAATYWYHYGNTQPLRIDAALAKTLLTGSWPLILSGLVIMLFMKIDLILLDALANPVILGEYVSAAKISELWYAVPTVISVAMLPGLIQQKNNNRNGYMHTLEKWLRLSFWLSFAIAVFITFTAHLIIPFLYGASYAPASLMLMIHTWASIPVFTSIVLVQYLFIEGEYKAYLYANISGLIVNVALNLVLIPHYGGVGAAIATVVAYMTVYIVLVTLDKSKQGYLLTTKVFHPSLVFTDLKQIQNSFKIFALKQLTVNQKNTITNE